MFNESTNKNFKKCVQQLEQAEIEREDSLIALPIIDKNFRNLFEQLDIIIWAADLAFQTIYVSPSVEKSLGFTPKEWMKQSLEDQMTLPSYKTVVELFVHDFDEEDAKSIKPYRTIKLDLEYYHKNGFSIWFETLLSWIKDKSGTIIGIQGISIDITERMRADYALKESEEKFKYVFDHSVIGKSITSPIGEMTANKAFYSMLGYSKEEFQNLKWEKITHPNDKGLSQKAIDSILSGEKKSERFIKRYIHKDGTVVWADVTTTLRRDKEGNPLYFIASISDITDLKQTEQRIIHLNQVLRSIRGINQLIVRERDSEKLLRKGCRLLVDNRGYASILIVHTNKNGIPVSWADAGMEDSIGKMDTLLASGILPPCLESVRHVDGVVQIKGGHELCVTCPKSDNCKEPHALCVRLSHGGQVFGFMAASLRQELNVNDEEQGLFQEIAGDLAYALSFMTMDKDLEKSEQKQKETETQLLQAQKMEAVGRLAGGVAHDYNNMLSVIVGYTELALDNTELPGPLHDDLTEVLNAAKRSADITRQLLAFARKQVVEPRVLDLNTTVEGMLKMLRRLIGEDIDLSWLPVAGLGTVNMDPSQVDQIIANLCVNARDAIADVGKVTIEMANVSFDEAYCAEHAGFIPGDFILLAISDDGCGMDRETINNIFEPFFTTKELGRGTGLGLSTVYGIVKQNCGFINVYSEPGKGTTFKIYLSRHAGKEETIETKGVNKIPASQGETLLLVEDDSSILKLGQKILSGLGYAVLTAGTPMEAIHLAQEYTGEIQLLITDVIMPEMNGRELAECLLSLHPDIKTLFMSGYTADVIVHHGVLEAGVHFLQKPFSKSNLGSKVREAIEG